MNRNTILLATLFGVAACGVETTVMGPTPTTSPDDEEKPEAYDSGGCTDCDEDGWSVADGDCNDRDPTVNPSMTDRPNDAVDQDCDGVVANATPPFIEVFYSLEGEWDTALLSVRGALYEVPLNGGYGLLELEELTDEDEIVTNVANGIGVNEDPGNLGDVESQTLYLWVFSELTDPPPTMLSIPGFWEGEEVAWLPGWAYLMCPE